MIEKTRGRSSLNVFLVRKVKVYWMERPFLSVSLMTWKSLIACQTFQMEGKWFLQLLFIWRLMLHVLTHKSLIVSQTFQMEGKRFLQLLFIWLLKCNVTCFTLKRIGCSWFTKEWFHGILKKSVKPCLGFFTHNTT